jgi:hypothetical protein
MDDWSKVNEWERQWWGSCQNTYGEETKQLSYAHYMGLKIEANAQGSPCINAKKQSVLDIGGGPCSLLLKCYNLLHGGVIDPCEYPDWVEHRYKHAHISYWRMKAEMMPKMSYPIDGDEVWMYNVLQHVEDPKLVLYNAWNAAKKRLRIFDWIHVPKSDGHPHVLTPDLFYSVIPYRTGLHHPGAGTETPAASLAIPGAPGPAFYGVFEK